MSNSLRKGERRLKLLGQQLDQTIASRPCDGCTACCTVLGVEEFNKAPGVKCQHEGVGCCNIYPTRPESCREFLCVWRMGAGTAEERPDKVGIVLDHARKHILEGKAILAREVWPGAFTESHEFLMRLAQRGQLIFLIGSNGKPRRVMGPEPKIRAVQPILEKMLRGE